MIDKNILTESNGIEPNGFAKFPNFNIWQDNNGEYTISSFINCGNKELLPIGEKGFDLTVMIIKMYKHALKTLSKK
jgi:hypothetical protein